MEHEKSFEVPDLGEERRETDNEIREEKVDEENLEMESTDDEFLDTFSNEVREPISKDEEGF